MECLPSRSADSRLYGGSQLAVLGALALHYHPHFVISVNTGLRWSEQMNLRGRDVDLLTGFITVPRSKNGRARRVPLNSTVRSVLLDLEVSVGTPTTHQRRRTSTPTSGTPTATPLRLASSWLAWTC